MEKRVVIIGAGPTGLGAAYRLQERGYKNWAIYERSSRVGGLSASFIDREGFTWDLGGHVLFSHYDYFDHLLDRLLGDGFIEHQRESWVNILERWVPYPFQNNIRHLPPPETLECLMGLLRAEISPRGSKNFHEWILETFGQGIARLFMLPYNFKVWATPLEMMAKNWIAERVSVVDFEHILENVILGKDSVGWGPNNVFKYPERGGTGGLFTAFVPYIEKNLETGKDLETIDTRSRALRFSDGSADGYDALISTMPLDRLVRTLRPKRRELAQAARMLRHNSVFVAGIGLRKPTGGTRCWMYFPEDDVPFYRVTNFSFYSPWNVPERDTGNYSSFLCEISHSPEKVEEKETVVERTIDGLILCGLMEPGDRPNVVSRWLHDIDYAYPVPTIDRDKALDSIQPVLMEMGILSRGRFGCWRYEAGNMDHSVMIGVEAADRILDGSPESIAGFPSNTQEVKTI